LSFQRINAFKKNKKIKLIPGKHFPLTSDHTLCGFRPSTVASSLLASAIDACFSLLLLLASAVQLALAEDQIHNSVHHTHCRLNVINLLTAPPVRSEKATHARNDRARRGREGLLLKIHIIVPALCSAQVVERTTMYFCTEMFKVGCGLMNQQTTGHPY
jgi:hypothetical protein